MCGAPERLPRAETHLKFSDQLIQGLTGGEFFLLKMGHVGYQKIRLFTYRIQKCKLTL
jgi:hypothetical protein